MQALNDQLRQLTEDKNYLQDEYEKVNELYISNEQELINAKMMWA